MGSVVTILMKYSIKHSAICLSQVILEPFSTRMIFPSVLDDMYRSSFLLQLCFIVKYLHMALQNYCQSDFKSFFQHFTFYHQPTKGVEWKTKRRDLHHPWKSPDGMPCDNNKRKMLKEALKFALTIVTENHVYIFL